MRCLLLVGLAVVAATLLLSGEGRAESTDSSSLRRYQHHHTHHGSSNNNAVVKPFFNDQMRVGLATIVPRARAWAQEFLDSNVRQATSTMTADADAQNQLQPLQFDDVPVPYTLCSGSGGALVTIQSLTSTIWPPKLGSSLTLTAKALVSQQINDGTSNALVSFDGILLVNQTDPLSNVTSLPILAGPLVMSRNVTVPSSVPLSGTIGLRVSAKNEQNAPLFCLQVSFDI